MKTETENTYTLNQADQRVMDRLYKALEITKVKLNTIHEMIVTEASEIAIRENMPLNSVLDTKTNPFKLVAPKLPERHKDSVKVTGNRVDENGSGS